MLAWSLLWKTFWWMNAASFILISTRFTRFCHCSVLGKGVSTWTSGAGVNAVELACSYLLLGLKRVLLVHWMYCTDPDTSSMFPCFKTVAVMRKSCGCRIVVDPFCGSAVHVHTASHGPFEQAVLKSFANAVSCFTSVGIQILTNFSPKIRWL